MYRSQCIVEYHVHFQLYNWIGFAKINTKTNFLKKYHQVNIVDVITARGTTTVIKKHSETFGNALKKGETVKEIIKCTRLLFRVVRVARRTKTVFCRLQALVGESATKVPHNLTTIAYWHYFSLDTTTRFSDNGQGIFCTFSAILSLIRMCQMHIIKLLHIVVAKEQRI